MKAVGVTEFGGPESLHLLELPVPQAGAGEIRIRVSAATVNLVDAMVRRGQAFVSDAKPPYVPGMEAAGIVDPTVRDVRPWLGRQRRPVRQSLRWRPRDGRPGRCGRWRRAG